jgi:hypothetical protein
MNFKGALFGVVAAALLAASSPAHAALSVDQRQADFTQLVNTVQRNYGPLRWKKETIGLDFNKLVATTKAKIDAVKTDAEFYRVLAAFISAFHDAHTTATLPSNYRAGLGFTPDLIQGKVLIDRINRLQLPKALFPFEKGDQLISIGGVPVEKMIEELKEIGHTGNEKGSMRIAAARLTSRREASGMEVPTGNTLVTVLPRGAEKPVTVMLTWNVAGSPLADLDDLSNTLSDATPTADDLDSFTAEVNKLPALQMMIPKAQILEWQRAGVEDMASKQSMFELPEGAKQIDGIPVTAAIFEAAGKRIGVLRINSYSDGLLESVSRALTVMQDETDVLVIDQTNNPGGSVTLVSQIVSLFANGSYQDMLFELRPSLAWLKTFQDINSQLDDLRKENASNVVANALKGRFSFLEGEVRNGIQQRKFSTARVSLNFQGGFGMIQPNDALQYTKPVLMLINEFDFSGGDMFPALMKDNKRAVLFGQQTTGAGGNVREYGPLANSNFRFNLTESLMVRPNGAYVENRGIQPDIAYDISEDDFLNGYRGYVRAFTVAALNLVGVSEAQLAADEAAKAAAPKPAPAPDSVGEPVLN